MMTKKIFGILALFMAILMTISTCLAEEAAPLLKDDFYGAVNAQWLSSAEIPADKPVTGGFIDLSDDIEKILMADFSEMLSGNKEPDHEELASFIEFYRLATDFETREADGVGPLLPYMEMVENLTSLEDYAKQWAEWDLQGMPVPFSAYVMADMKNADMNALYLSAPSLFLLDKSYYQDEATRQALQGLYAQMSTNLLVMAGKTQEEAAVIVEQALAFDASLAPYTYSAEESSDYTKMYNPMDFAEFAGQIKGVDLAPVFTGLLGTVPETVICTNPEYFAALDALMNEETFQNMKSWMLVMTVNGFAPLLTDGFRVESESFGRMISGTAESTSRERGAFNLATSVFGEVVGIYYGKEHFGEQAKQDVTQMVQTIISAFESRLSANPWLNAETREMAIRKLKAMSIHVGYPDEIRPVYRLMQTLPAADGGTLVGNMMEFARLIKKDNYAEWNTPVDRGLWPLSANVVNAMYSPMENSINFPAAILQAPFYSLEQSPSANYGGIGAVIAHEISHAFDPNGSKFDELGNLADWWTAEDYAKFTELSGAMIKEFDGVPFASGTVNGAMTVAENVADAGGLSCALEAAKALEDVDLEAFFTNWAVIWRQKAMPEYEALLLTLDVHAPSPLRANIQLQNMDDFYVTFDIQEGDGMYRAPEDRVNIW